MFSIQCMELVKTPNQKFNPTVKYNKEILDFHKHLMELNKETSKCKSRCICPYNFQDTNINKYHTHKCKNCTKCAGSLIYHIWFTNFQIEGCIDTLNDNRQGLDFKKACFSHLRKYRKKLKKELIEAHYLGL